MSDLDTMKAMLEGANIPYRAEVSGEEFAEPAGGVSLIVGDTYGPEQPRRWMVQPHEGGYGGFYTQIVFDPDGNLWAVWAWE